jgi:hypothetical protein
MSEITPEERAAKVHAKWFSAPGTEFEGPMDLKGMVTLAITEAVAQEREACALVADRWAEFQRGESGSYDCPALEERIQGRLDASQKIAVIIRARRHRTKEQTDGGKGGWK